MALKWRNLFNCAIFVGQFSIERLHKVLSFGAHFIETAFTLVSIATLRSC
ncbi:MAG: Unknown protein [uncultured Thiotrichaceae bacterium]|uniref:Uncharacterized protein n=1 Tax=uncultured Thiotrichaceae bacterium TaxID=298394 RepID=A0A6S6SNG6_9GAMM|nr:MAG: Unknown protein [uncultured Thiotrichaceae bacterium]